MSSVLRPVFLLLVTAAVVSTSASADEGMWLLTRPPVEQLKARYDFEPSAAWLEHLQKACVRMGASGSLVSADGLVMTNHHVGAGQLHKLSTAERDLLKDGFYAPSRDAELKCPDMEMQILWTLEDVTERVTRAAAADASAADAYEARRAEMTRIEEESQAATGLDSEVVTLYHGARYHLYRYKRYTDVRLVMAPEGAIAHFGGDVDNFEYPRFCLDVCFFRIYENDAPLKCEHYLRLSREGASEGELAFVLGHPGRTRRLLTVDHLAFVRDVEMPLVLRSLWRREVRLSTFCERDKELARIGNRALMSVQNSRKARMGGYLGLLDPALMQAQRDAERELRRAATTRPAEQDPWNRIASAQAQYRHFFPRYDALRSPGYSRLFEYALSFVRLAEELPKPSAQRLREYRDAELDSLYLWLYSPAPIYDVLEIEHLQSGLANMAELLGAEDPAVRTALAGMAPDARAAQLVGGTTFKDVETRRRLVEGGKAAIESSDDLLIRLARAMDPELRTLRKRHEDTIESVEREAYAAIAAEQFRLFGERLYPDATGTLRLAFGPVIGYEDGGEKIEPFTTYEGLYRRWTDRAGHREFQLPELWEQRRERLNPKTPLNFVLAADIIGGNSGSPVVNARGEVTGLIFDGNIHSLSWDFAYDERRGRAVAVDVRGIVEALRSVYAAEPLVNELMQK